MTTQAATAFPLYWPTGRPRAGQRLPARFKANRHGFATLAYALEQELHRLRATEIVISTNLQLRRDGLPYSDQRRPADPGVAVYFKYKGKEVCFACDRWNTTESNIHAITLTIEALRGIARWGTGDMVDAAFAGFTALPAPAASWQTTLGVPHNATLDQAEEAFNRLAMVHHPDRGGDHERMAKLNDAIERARKELKR